MRDPATSVIYIFIIYFLGPFNFLKIGEFIKQTRGYSEKKPSARFISFDSDDGKIDIELDLSVPFITIPLNKEIKNIEDQPPSLVKINTKAIVVLGVLLATSALIVPLFIKPANPTDQRYRKDEEFQWWNMSPAINDVLLRNAYVTPCVQRLLCSAMSTIKHTKNPTSTEKIIDGLVSHRRFKQFVNGSLIMDAVSTGQKSEKDCITTYKGCPVTQKIIDNALRALNVI